MTHLFDYRNYRRFAFIALLGLIASCASRPGPEVLQTHEAAEVPGGKQVKVYVATTRARQDLGSNVFTTGRSTGINYAEFTISIPPGHRDGQIEWPKTRPDAAVSFVTVEQQVLDETSFKASIRARQAALKNPNVGVFVHGFNYSFQEALFRLAQMAADADVPAIPILFAWPSEAAVTGYVADKEAVTFSRDQLAEVLEMATTAEAARSTALVGHSMGAWLTVEALRQLRLEKKNAVLDRLDVILAAPDIDVDVFRQQMQVIGPMRKPMTILVSPDDRALFVSGKIAGARTRLGALNINDPKIQEAAVKSNIQIVDISKLDASDSFRHDRYVSLAKLYPRLASAEQQSAGRQLRQAGAFVFNSVGATLSSPFALAGKALGGR